MTTVRRDLHGRYVVQPLAQTARPDPRAPQSERQYGFLLNASHTHNVLLTVADVVGNTAQIMLDGQNSAAFQAEYLEYLTRERAALVANLRRNSPADGGQSTDAKFMKLAVVYLHGAIHSAALAARVAHVKASVERALEMYDEQFLLNNYL